MCMIDGCDSYWRMYRIHERRARIAHTCRECQRTIEPGEHYRVWCGLDEDGDWFAGKECAHCRAAARWLSEVCAGYVAEHVLEDLTEHWREGAQYRTAWLGRAIVGLRRRWRRRDGTLLPVPGAPVYTLALAPHVRRVAAWAEAEAAVESGA